MASVDSLPVDEEGLASDVEWKDEEEGPWDGESKEEEAHPMKTRVPPSKAEFDDIMEMYAEHV